MKTTCKVFALSICVIVVGFGCSGSVTQEPADYQQKFIFTTRYRDIGTSVLPSAVGHLPPPVDHFGPEETPTVVVVSCGGKTVTVYIVDLSSGKAGPKETAYIPVGKSKFFTYPDIPAGSYNAKLEIHGITVDTSTFLVSR